MSKITKTLSGKGCFTVPYDNSGRQWAIECWWWWSREGDFVTGHSWSIESLSSNYTVDAI